MKAPCLNCPKVGCGSYHDICPEYQEYRKLKEQEYKKNWQFNQTKYDHQEVIRRQIARAKQGS